MIKKKIKNKKSTSSIEREKDKKKKEKEKKKVMSPKNTRNERIMPLNGRKLFSYCFFSSFLTHSRLSSLCKYLFMISRNVNIVRLYVARQHKQGLYR